MLPKLAALMMEYFYKPAYAEHAIKVYAYASLIGRSENLTKEEMDTLCAAAILHDIGIPPAMTKYGSAEGPYQEHEGEKLVPGFMEQVGGERLSVMVGWLVGHHHSHSFAEQDRLLQILMEADYLVNLAEGNLEGSEPEKVRDDFFRTEAGIAFINGLFALEKDI